MFRSRNIRKILLTLVALTMILGTVGLAVGEVYQKQITATMGKIKFEFDGRDVTQDIENKYGTPAFISDGRSYVPVMAIADLMGIDVEWNSETNTAKLTDSEKTRLNMELLKRDMEINNLKKEIESLNQKLKEKDTSKEETKPEKKPEPEKTTLEKLEKQLNDKYSSYKNVDFTISVRETANRLNVEVNTNLRERRQENAWGIMGFMDKRSMAEDIVFTLFENYAELDVYGTVYDGAYRRNLMTFSKRKASKTVAISTDSHGVYVDDWGWPGGDYNLDTLVYNEFIGSGIRDARVSGRSYGVNGSVSFNISFPATSENEANWDKISPGNLLYRVASDALYDYSNYDPVYDPWGYYGSVTINVYMGDTPLGEYYRDYRSGSGSYTPK